MQRHRKLIRAVLEYAEAHAVGVGVPPPEVEGHSVTEVNYGNYILH